MLEADFSRKVEAEQVGSMAHRPQSGFETALYRQLIEQIPAITYVAERGAEGRWYYISPQVTQFLGFTPEEWRSDPLRWRKQVHPNDLQRILLKEQSLMREGDHYCVDYRLRNRDGKDIWVRDEATYVRQPETGGFVMRGLLLDITELKQAEEDLRSSELRLETTINAAPVVLFALDPAGIFTFSAGKGLHDLGLKPGEVVGKSVFDLYRDTPQTLDHARRALSGEEFTAIDEIPQSRRLYETRWAPSMDGAGNQLGAIGVATDITERTRLQEQLRTMQQQEAIGRLAGGVAHDFNNLMNIVLGHAVLLSEQADLTERTKNGLAQIRRAAERAASLTHQLLAFSRKQVLQPKVVNLNDIVTDVQKMLARVIGEDIELISRLDPCLAQLRADPTQLEQVLMNLAVNARDAMPQGGKLRMETSNITLDKSFARQHPDFQSGKYVLLTVSDTGHGMNSETLKHIFEPFFTTKQVGKGTGMGLATVYGIITQSGGKIEVTSEVDKGTTFSIYFPAEAGSVKSKVEAPQEKIVGGTETILLVEDEPNLREITRIFLEEYGYQVLEASDVEHALQTARSFADTIHLILTDVIMPGLSGRQLAEQISQLRPGIKTLYMTGYTDDMVVEHKVLEPGVALLTKPFDKFQLARRMRQVLDGL